MHIIDRQSGRRIQVRFYRTQPEDMRHLPWDDELPKFHILNFIKRILLWFWR